MKGSSSFPQVSVVRQVAMWGRVIEHERGWRSEFAYPQRLRMVCAVCAHVGRRRGDPLLVASLRAGLSEGFVLTAVCAVHRESPAANSDRPYLPVDEVLAPLLDRYAVDLLPSEAVRPLWGGGPRVGSRPRNPSPSASPKTPSTRSSVKVLVSTMPLWNKLLDAVMTAGRVVGLTLFWGFFVVLGLRSCVVTVDTSDDALPAALAGSGGISEGEVIVASYPKLQVQLPSPPAPQRHEAARIRAVCGRSHGQWIEYVECKSSTADVIGLAQSPPAPCRAGDAFTRRRDFSVCWLFWPDEGSVDLDPEPSAGDPFAGRV